MAGAVGAVIPVELETRFRMDHSPVFPASYRPGIGIVGCGSIVKEAHLPAYAAYGVEVVGVYDPAAAATEGLREQFPSVGRVFSSLDELLGHPEIEVVDIATHPAVRLDLIRRAIGAGKHVLAQKPLALDARAAREVVEEAERSGVTVAVNQNGRWAPPWRVATLLLEQGAIGEVVAVTHLHDHDFAWIVGSVFDEMPHFAIYDFSMHWVDITRCWLEGKTVATVRAVDYRTPNQPPASKGRWGAWVAVDYVDGSSALIRCIGSAVTERPGNPFWIHGTDARSAAACARGRTSWSSIATARWRATRSWASGFPTVSRGRWPSSSRPSPRIASRSTRRVTTCCRCR